jgi:hypothetical protein
MLTEYDAAVGAILRRAGRGDTVRLWGKVKRTRLCIEVVCVRNVVCASGEVAPRTE